MSHSSPLQPEQRKRRKSLWGEENMPYWNLDMHDSNTFKAPWNDVSRGVCVCLLVCFFVGSMPFPFLRSRWEFRTIYFLRSNSMVYLFLRLFVRKVDGEAHASLNQILAHLCSRFTNIFQFLLIPSNRNSFLGHTSIHFYKGPGARAGHFPRNP